MLLYARVTDKELSCRMPIAILPVVRAKTLAPLRLRARCALPLAVALAGG